MEFLCSADNQHNLAKKIKAWFLKIYLGGEKKPICSLYSQQNIFKPINILQGQRRCLWTGFSFGKKRKLLQPCKNSSHSVDGATCFIRNGHFISKRRATHHSLHIALFFVLYVRDTCFVIFEVW